MTYDDWQNELHKSYLLKLVDMGLMTREEADSATWRSIHFNCRCYARPIPQGVTQMTHNEALAKLTQLEQEAKELRAILEKPERAPSLLSVPEVGEGYWQITDELCGQFSQSPNTVTDAPYRGNCFATRELAKDYAEAIDTMLLLRHQPGTVAPDIAVTQWTVRTELTTANIWISGNKGADFSDLLCPIFSSEALAVSAVSAVGEDRILRMFKVLHHVDN